MKVIVSSIVFNLIGMVLLMGSIIKSTLKEDVNKYILLLGIILVVLGLIVLFFHKDNLKQISGLMVSSNMTIIHKFFFSLITFILIQNVLYALLLMLLKSESFDWSIIMGMIIFICTFFIPIRMISLKAVKFNKDHLFISNYFKYRKIELADVTSIKSNNLLKIYRIRYNYEGNTKICYFLAKTQFLGFTIDDNLRDLLSVIKK